MVVIELMGCSTGLQERGWAQIQPIKNCPTGKTPHQSWPLSTPSPEQNLWMKIKHFSEFAEKQTGRPFSGRPQ
jgi:hypothetical protein